MMKTMLLKDIVSTSIKNGYSPVCDSDENGKWVLGLGALTGISLDISQIKPAPLNDNKVDQFILKNGDFLVSRSNTRDKVGRVALYREHPIICSYPDLMMRFRVNETLANPDYVEKVLQGFAVQKYLQQSASGTSVSMVKINKSVVENIEVPLPTLPEQQAIVDVLESWDKAIALTEKLVKAKEKQFSYQIHRLILDLQTNSFSKSIQLEDICSITTGSKDVNEGDTEGSYPFFTCGKDHIYSKEFSFDTTAILIAGNGNIGNPQLYTGKFEAYQRTYVLYDFKQVSAQYLLFYLTATLRKQIEKERQQGAMPYIKLSTLAKFMMYFPPIHEQDQFASFLSSLRQEIYLLEQIECKFVSQKQALMQKLLTGEWRVKR